MSFKSFTDNFWLNIFCCLPRLDLKNLSLNKLLLDLRNLLYYISCIDLPLKNEFSINTFWEHHHLIHLCFVIDCYYDGGDCCTENITIPNCRNCFCKGKTISNPRIGDGFCQDEYNNIGCNYDGGDCCGCTIKESCSDCQCRGETQMEYGDMEILENFCYSDFYNTYSGTKYMLDSPY